MSDKIWFISDTHFNHKNIIKLCNRPFVDIEEMDNTIIDGWNAVVGKNDIVYHLGDFAFGNKEQITNYVKRLNGKINLIKGNHDSRSDEFYRECGFNKVYDKPIVLDEFFILSHEPLPFSCQGPMANLYGHVHNSEMFFTWKSHSACMCVERHLYLPVSFEDVKRHLAEEFS